MPNIIRGHVHSDARGKLLYNNDFNLAAIKRMYVINNASESIKRAWQGHKIEQRWFVAVSGTFRIELIKIDCWEMPNPDLTAEIFILSDLEMHVLHVPPGYVSAIQSLTQDARFVVYSDYGIGEIEDDYKFEANYFKNYL